MQLKNWLLTGTSLCMLALAPVSAHAQNGEIAAAYQALLAARSSGDAAAAEAAQTTLNELCIAGGYTSIDECIAAIGTPAEPAVEPEPQPEPAPAPEAVEEPAPEAAPVEEPAPEVVEEPAPAPAPEAVEEPAPEPAPEVFEETAPPPEPEMVEEPVPQPEPEFVEEPAAEPAPEPAPVEEPEPEPQPQTKPAEQPAPAEEPAPVEQPAPAEEPAADIGGALAAQVDIYNGAIADMMAGGDPAAARIQLDAARAEMEAICAEAGYPSLDQCLAEHGITLPAVPAIEQPAEQPPAEEPATREPAVEEPAPEAPAEEPAAETPATELPAETPVDQAVELFETLPEGVSEEDIAPVLDSVKDADVAPAEGEAAVDASAEAPPPAEPVAPPSSDIEAQSRLAVDSAAVVSATEETGERVDFQAIEPVTVPQNVTIINQTNVTNNVTNNVQNNTVTNNYGDVLTQVIVQVGNQLIINNRGQDTDRFTESGEDEVYYERLGNGRIRETVVRPDGSQIVTVRNRNGDILRRSRITPDGREYILAWFDDRYDEDLLEWRDPGLDLPPLRLTIPVREYVLDARNANADEIEYFFAQPPVEQVTRLYSIDEVKRSARVRDTVRRLEVGNLTFDTGSANIGRDQVQTLSAVAGAMIELLARNPAETFLIEGHTDAVGSDISNLALSDQRAATVARILTDFYGVPPENLATQGYGERYLKIRTERAERENRRVTVRRITPLITPYAASTR